MNLKEFKEYCINQHDVICNQKYAKTLPYSFHLQQVVNQHSKFCSLILKSEYDVAEMGCWGHDLIEDARITYNDLTLRAGTIVADIIYCCTEEKGRNREERHSQKYFDELKQNRLAVYVKMCDIIANVIMSLMENSSMYKKYKREYPKVKQELYREEFRLMFSYLEALLQIQ